VSAYVHLWKQVDSRLNAAFGLLLPAVPERASAIGPRFHDYIEHNELELALDELLSSLDDPQASPPRRFLEESLVAAMLMRLRDQFTLVSSRIGHLGPHPFGVTAEPPHLWCDFNGFVEKDVYLLDSVGTALDAARLNLLLEPGLRVVLYDEDDPQTWLLADAELCEFFGYGLVARVASSSYRNVQLQTR
jgi:hypothetical protein